MNRLPVFLALLVLAVLIGIGLTAWLHGSRAATPIASPTPRRVATPLATVAPTHVPTPQPSPAPTRAPTAVPAALDFWHTNGTRIVDSHGRTVRLAGVTWYGMESSYWVPAGLNFQPYTSIMDLVKKLGYNAIRLPFSNELVESNPIVTRKVDANPQFRGRHAMYVMDSIVAYAKHIGLRIILDDHRSRASRPSTVNLLPDSLWYTAQYPESSWIHDWQFLARRYRHNDAVIGFDLRNEPHTNGPGPWSLHTYLYQGSTWGPYQGYDNPATDWRPAAERGGNAVLAVNPHLLIFVEGVQLYPDSNQPSGVEEYWWGSILTGIQQYPVVLDRPHQLVYSAHDWGPFKYPMPWFKGLTYATALKVWNTNWGFLVAHPHASYAAPLWIGEFGTCTNDPQCVDDQRPGNQAAWFHMFLRYLGAHPNVGWSFYALNGTNSNDHHAHNGLLNPQWNDVANSALQSHLGAIQR